MYCRTGWDHWCWHDVTVTQTKLQDACLCCEVVVVVVVVTTAS